MKTCRSCAAVRCAALLISCVVMAWVPVMFALADAAPEIKAELQRSTLMIGAAFHVASLLQRAQMVLLMLVLLPVLVLGLLLDVLLMCVPHVQRELLRWAQMHIEEIGR